MPEVKPSARVTAIESECDEVAQKWTITVERSFGESPNVMDLPDDIQRALMAWMLQHVPQRVVMGFPEGWREGDPDIPLPETALKPLERFLPDGDERCQNRYGEYHLQCGGWVGHPEHPGGYSCGPGVFNEDGSYTPR